MGAGEGDRLAVSGQNEGTSLWRCRGGDPGGELGQGLQASLLDPTQSSEVIWSTIVAAPGG